MPRAIKKKTRLYCRLELCALINTCGFTHTPSHNSDLSDCEVCKCFAIDSTQRRMTVTFDAAQLFRGVPAESYFHRMLCMHFSDRLLQETGALGGGGWEQTRLEWNTNHILLNEANHRAGHKESCSHFIFLHSKNNNFHTFLKPLSPQDWGKYIFITKMFYSHKHSSFLVYHSY